MNKQDPGNPRRHLSDVRRLSVLPIALAGFSLAWTGEAIYDLGELPVAALHRD
ncbi:hypothetical protein Areg01_71630 [Actinoplanes regularis]|nr:hypothetical protein Areg01_71630 [Actinoplanes regularis]